MSTKYFHNQKKILLLICLKNSKLANIAISIVSKSPFFFELKKFLLLLVLFFAVQFLYYHWRRNPYPHPAGRSSFICLLLGHPSGLTFPVWLHVCPGPILQVARDLCEDSGSVSLALQGHGQGLRDRNGQAGS